MNTHYSVTFSGLGDLERAVLKTLFSLTSPVAGQPPPPPDEWPVTRQISDIHDVSIYKARLLLLSLAEQGWVIVSKVTVNKSLRWYPVIPRDDIAWWQAFNQNMTFRPD